MLRKKKVEGPPMLRMYDQRPQIERPFCEKKVEGPPISVCFFFHISSSAKLASFVMTVGFILQ
jgi:hypothetical protein